VAEQPRRNALILTPDEWAELVMSRLRNELRHAALMVGDKEARRLWKAAAKKPRGKPPGSTRPKQDEILLEFYDRLVAFAERPDPIKSLPREVGRIAHERARGQFGLSANAVTTKLRRLLKKRKEEVAVRSLLSRHPLDPDWQNK
jgi:hypothetical protein